ncbi:MAG TPA: 2OG-Fe(II) oxygenase [Steroidobacteraceae bacterium]|nr:2OG-Fe(II) oxygenase [Steroidobacteraceae bacterium]
MTTAKRSPEFGERPPARPSGDLASRVSALDWACIEQELDESGHAVARALLDASQCRALASLYGHADRFRSTITMAHHGFGRGEYRYFQYPLPDDMATLRSALYPRLAPIANRWNELMGIADRYPPHHRDFIARCHAAGQTRPTPLLLRYGPGDHNCLHQDLYGACSFPLQLTVLLSLPGADFSGGEFVLVEQRPRRQSRVEVVSLGRGDAVIFAVHHRPVKGTRGCYRVQMRHGVSPVRQGERTTAGIIFHDAR